jgi:RND family efflux transporter MFP subunit
MKKALILLALLAAAAVAAVLLLRPVAKVATVVPGHAVKAVPGSVAVHAEYQMELKSEQGGRVLTTALDPGKKVAEGEVLVQIDTGDLKLEIERIESEYEASKQRLAVGSSIKLELRNAQEGFQNLERMTKAGTYPLAELEKQRRGVQQIEQRVALEEVNNRQLVEGYENTLKVRRRQLQKMTVRAPFDGVIAAVYARPGDLIGGGAPIATIISKSRTVEARISEEYFAGVKLGQKASVRFLGYGEWLYDATVEKILPTADPETQRYIVHLKVEIDPDKLVPGITGEVTIVVGERDAQAIIPRRALTGNTVLVVEDGRVRQREVETGYVSVTAVEVLKGLKPGEQVIVDQIDLFRNGDRVKVEVVPAK